MQLSGRILVFMAVYKEGSINIWCSSQSLLFLANILGEITDLQRWVRLVFWGHLALSSGVLLGLILLSDCWLVCTWNGCCQELGKQDLQTCPEEHILYSPAASSKSVTQIGRGKEFWVFCIQLESFPVWCVNWWFAGRKYSGLWKTATVSGAF